MTGLYDHLDERLRVSDVDPCARKHGGNTNSVAAWNRASHILSGRKRQILGALCKRRKAAGKTTLISLPRTCEEIADAIGVKPHQISGRFASLKEAGLIRRCGKRTTERETTADVWQLTGPGLELVAKWLQEAT